MSSFMYLYFVIYLVILYFNDFVIYVVCSLCAHLVRCVFSECVCVV